MTDSQLVLLSGGMDSTVALASAENPRMALSVFYGQRHARELMAAADVAEYYGIEHRVIDLSGWGQLLTGSSLTDPTVPVPDGQYDAPNMAVTVVPNRNAVFLMAAVGVAESRGINQVITAIHAGDHTIYPDCRPEFIESAAMTAGVATEGRVSILAPFVNLTKTEVAALGWAHNAPLQLTWSCYKGGDRQCGTCGTCTERREAFHDAGLVDPTEYEVAL